MRKRHRIIIPNVVRFDLTAVLFQGYDFQQAVVEPKADDPAVGIDDGDDARLGRLADLVCHIALGFCDDLHVFPLTGALQDHGIVPARQDEEGIFLVILEMKRICYNKVIKRVVGGIQTPTPAL